MTDTEQGDVEKVARIVDDEAFFLIEHYNGLPYFGSDKMTATEKEAGTFRAYPVLKERRDTAFAKAREIIAALKASPPEGDDDTWRKPPPHFKPDPRWQRQPQSVEEWDLHQDAGGHEYNAKRRLAFAGDRADPRAPKGMALVSRWDVNTVLGRLTWLEARFENTKGSMLPAPLQGDQLAKLKEFCRDQGARAYVGTIGGNARATAFEEVLGKIEALSATGEE